MEPSLHLLDLPHKKYDCCNDDSNLELQDSGKSDLELKVCKICGRRHFELTVDAGKLGVTGVGL